MCIGENEPFTSLQVITIEFFYLLSHVCVDQIGAVHPYYISIEQKSRFPLACTYLVARGGDLAPYRANPFIMEP